MGTAGADVFRPYFGHDSVDGGAGTDLLYLDYSLNRFAGTPDRPAGMSFYSGYPVADPGTGVLSLINGGAVANKVITDNDSVSFKNIELFSVRGTIGNDTLSIFADWSGNDTLFGLDGNDVLAGGAGDDSINGGTGNDIVYGGTGNDRVDAGSGNDEVFTGVSGYNGAQRDTVVGGDGIDTLHGADFSAATSALSFNDNGTVQMAVTLAAGTTASGFEYIDEIATGSGADSILFSKTRRTNFIRSGAGNDTVNSGLGNDTVDGGWGSDLLVVNYSSNTFAGDASRSSGLSFYSGATVVEQGGRNYLASGGAVANRVVGTDSMAINDFERFHVTGTAFNDTITVFSSWEGNDSLFGGKGNDSIAAGAENDCLSGGDGLDTLYGESGNDTLDGGTGADALYGALGNDFYYVDSASDRIYEAADGGTDSVRSAISWTLADNLENLALTGTLAISGTGNSAGNLLAGNAYANRLDGRDGRDTLTGGLGNDSLSGGAGADYLNGFGGPAGLEIDTLTGGADADRFVLGSSTVRFYDDATPASTGVSGYALITDFTAGMDLLQLHGAASEYRLESGGVSGVSGTGLWHEQGSVDELIAILRPASGSVLTTETVIRTAIFV